MGLYSRKHKSQKINDRANADSTSAMVSQDSPGIVQDKFHADGHLLLHPFLPTFDCFLPEIINHAYILLQTNKLRMTLAQGKEPTVLYQHIAGYYFIWIIQSAAWKSCFLTRISFCRSKVRGAILNDTEDDG